MTPNQSAITPLLMYNSKNTCQSHYTLKGRNKEEISRCESHNQTWKKERLTGSKQRKINITKGSFPWIFQHVVLEQTQLAAISISMGRCVVQVEFLEESVGPMRYILKTESITIQIIRNRLVRNDFYVTQSKGEVARILRNKKVEVDQWRIL